ncbi:retrovirus-related pol polyprotein from transposon TNT 1-94 [Tanacetum coccineum]
MSSSVIKKGAENLAADHLSKLENLHQSDPEKKEITKIFPLETLGMVNFYGDSNIPWFADIANYYAGNFIVKGIAEAEYVALFASCAQVMWMRTQLQDYGFNYNKIPLYRDSQSAIARDFSRHIKSQRSNSGNDKPQSIQNNGLNLLRHTILESSRLRQRLSANSDLKLFNFKIMPKVESTGKTRRPQPMRNTKNDRVPSTSKSNCIKNKEVEVEGHHRNLLFSKNKKHMSSECNNIKLAIQNDKSEVVCAMCKQCLITANHDVYVLNYVNGLNFRNANQSANVSNIANQKKHITKVRKPKKLGSKERLVSPKPSKPRICLRWSPTGRIFDLKGKLIASSEFECHPNLFMVRRLRMLKAYDRKSEASNKLCLEWENIMITRVYFIEGLGHNLLSVRQFCDSDLEVAFRRNTCFVRNLEGVDLLKGNRTTNLYTINLHEMAYASPICFMARTTSTKSWLWHQSLPHLNFDTINDLTKNDLVTGLPTFKYYKEHLCPSCEQGKSKKASHPPKLVPNSKQRLHLLHMDLCGSISKDEAPEVIKTFLKKIQVLLQAPVIIVRTDNDTEFKN